MFIEFRRVFRLIHALIWVITLAICVPAVYAIPRLGTWKAGIREAILAFFCRRCCACFNIKYDIIGKPCAPGHLVVANHISWIEIVLLLSQQPYSFIAKSEVKKWPIFGFVSRALGTFYIHRENKFAVYRDLPEGQKVLQRGQSLLVFPEGTTTMGDELLPFYPMMFELAVREEKYVQPVAICFYDEHGDRSTAAPFVGEESIIDSLIRVAGANSVRAEIHYLPLLDARKLDRKQLASKSKQAIYDSISQPSQQALIHIEPA